MNEETESRIDREWTEMKSKKHGVFIPSFGGIFKGRNGGVPQRQREGRSGSDEHHDFETSTPELCEKCKLRADVNGNILVVKRRLKNRLEYIQRDINNTSKAIDKLLEELV